MKRDMDLIREILLRVEARENPNSPWKVEIEGRDGQEIYGHVRLLAEAGLVEAFYSSGPTAMVNRLTWDGHEFLDSVHDSTVWAKVRKKLQQVGGTASLDVVKATASAVAKDLLGLGG